jgi:hypothetical protein
VFLSTLIANLVLVIHCLNLVQAVGVPFLLKLL